MPAKIIALQILDDPGGTTAFKVVAQAKKVTQLEPELLFCYTARSYGYMRAPGMISTVQRIKQGWSD